MKTSVWIIVIGFGLGFIGLFVNWFLLPIAAIMIFVGIIMLVGTGTAKAAKAGYKAASGDKTGTGRL